MTTEPRPPSPYRPVSERGGKGRLRRWWFEACAIAAIREGWRTRIYRPEAETPRQEARAGGALLPEPTPCSPDAEETGCTTLADACTCRVPFGCSEDEGGCCFCVHMDPYHPCPTFGFGCGPGCDCCTPYQQRQVFRQDRQPPSSEHGRKASSP